MATTRQGSALYDAVSVKIAHQLISQYSTSFGSAVRLLPKEMRADIAAIYGLVRIADEVVDTYRGHDAKTVCRELEADTHAAITREYSPNPVLHAFQITARRYGIGVAEIEPFFASMRFDCDPPTDRALTHAEYTTYIYGSAEVIGLMCLHVWCQGDHALFAKLAPGARALGAAFQKVNFLRDIAHDRAVLGRQYFPLANQPFDETAKRAIIADIRTDFSVAAPAAQELPPAVRPAVMTASRYFEVLLAKLEDTPAEVLLQRRVRLPNNQKAWIMARTYVRQRLKK